MSIDRQDSTVSYPMPAVRPDPNPPMYASSVFREIIWKVGRAFPAILCDRFQPKCRERFLSLHPTIPMPYLAAQRMQPSTLARIYLKGYNALLRLTSLAAADAASGAGGSGGMALQPLKNATLKCLRLGLCTGQPAIELRNARTLVKDCFPVLGRPCVI